jgi:hypothetical protein
MGKYQYGFTFYFKWSADLNGLLSFGIYVRGIGYEESCGIASI